MRMTCPNATTHARSTHPTKPIEQDMIPDLTRPTNIQTQQQAQAKQQRRQQRRQQKQEQAAGADAEAEAAQRQQQQLRTRSRCCRPGNEVPN